MGKKLIPLLAVFLCLLLDRVSKYLALKYLKSPMEVLPFLNFDLVYNTGFVFGIAQSWSGFLKPFLYIGIPLALVVLTFYFTLKVKGKVESYALALITGGGISNLWDRLLYGKVVDFIDFHIGSWHYPTFNVADICVSVGIAILVLKLFLLKRKEEETKKV
jgi:signal peptidase II